MDLTSAANEFAKQGFIGVVAFLLLSANIYQYLKARSDAAEAAKLLQDSYEKRIEEARDSSKEIQANAAMMNQAHIQAVEKFNENVAAMKQILDTTNTTVQFLLKRST